MQKLQLPAIQWVMRARVRAYTYILARADTRTRAKYIIKYIIKYK